MDLIDKLRFAKGVLNILKDNLRFLDSDVYDHFDTNQPGHYDSFERLY